MRAIVTHFHRALPWRWLVLVTLVTMTAMVASTSRSVLAEARIPVAPTAKAREVTPRGALDSIEKRNVEIFKAASPSVVHINTSRLQRNPFTAMVDQVPRGSGTGFVWDELGHIVTNFHVIANSDSHTVTLQDQSVWPAVVVGHFEDRDLAVLRIKAPLDKFKPLPLGSSRGLSVGQSVYAIGNPFGLAQTMTTGIVSALDREIPAGNGRILRGVIQSDAAINPGNSGGPLLDSAGLLIGVNTAIFSPSGASAGIGFSIPVDEVNRIVPRLIVDGAFIRPTLGIDGAGTRFLEALGLEPGVAVIDIINGGPASRAGLKPFRAVSNGRMLVGDVIVGLGKYPVKTLDDLFAALELHQPGNEVVLHVRRADKTIKVMAILARGQ